MIAMKKILLWKSLITSLVFCSASICQTVQNTVTLDVGKAKYKISRNIYGHFSEHLGHCIYEGLWVGEASPIPNTRGIRNDVVAALKKIQVPLVRWPGGC